MDYSPTKKHPLSDFHVTVTTTMTKESYPSNLPNADSSRRSAHIINGIWGDSIMKDPDASAVQTTIGTTEQRQRENKIRHRILLYSIIFVAASLVGGVIAVVASAHYGKKGASGEANEARMSDAHYATSTTMTTTSAESYTTRNPLGSLVPTWAALTDAPPVTTIVITMSTLTTVISLATTSDTSSATTFDSSTSSAANNTFSGSASTTGAEWEETHATP